MAKQIQFRRGSTDEHTTFVGALGEVTVDTTKNTVVVHDGTTSGGYTVAKESDLIGANIAVATLASTVNILEQTIAVLNPGDAAAEQSRLRANITAANIQISILQSNATSQALYINSLSGGLSSINATQLSQGIAQDLINNTLINVQNAAILANASLIDLYGNAVAQETRIINLNSVTSAFYAYANANVGTLYLGNISTNANLGAFQSYANSKIGNNSNSNLVVVSTAATTSVSAGALVVTGGAGIAGNLNVGTAIGFTRSTSAYRVGVNAAGQFEFVPNGIASVTTGTHVMILDDDGGGIWTSIPFYSNANLVAASQTASSSTSTGALVVVGGAGIGKELYIANTGDVSANIGLLFNSNISTQANLGAFQIWSNANVISLQNQITGANNTIQTISANVGAYQIYANANIGLLFNSNISTQANLGAYQIYANANIGTLFNANLSTQANLGAYQVYANANIGTITTTASAFYAYANTKIGTNTNGNLVVNSTTAISNSNGYNTTQQGALIVKGGTSIAGNLQVGGTGLAYPTDSFDQLTGTLYVAGGAAFGGRINAFGGLKINGSGFTSPVGTQWYGALNFVLPTSGATGEQQIYTSGTGDFTIRNASAVGLRILGSSDGNIVVESLIPSLSTITGALVVKGGAGLAGNLYAGGNIVTTATAASLSTSTGALVVTGGAGIAGDINQSQNFTTRANLGIINSLYVGQARLYSQQSSPNYSQMSSSDQTATPQAYLQVGNTAIFDSTGTGVMSITSGAHLSAGSFLRYGATRPLVYQLNSSTGTYTWYNTNGAAAGTHNSGATLTAAMTLDNFGNLTVPGAAILGSNTTGSNVVVVPTTVSTSTTTGALVVNGGAGIAGAAIVGGNIVAAATTTTTSTTTGALVVAGGAGIAGAAIVGGNIVAAATNTSTSTTTGALVVAGGAGIAGNINIGGFTTLRTQFEVFSTLSVGLSAGVVAHDISLGATFYHNTPLGPFVANFTNVPLTSNRVIIITLVIIQGSTPYVPSSIQINGTAQTVKYLYSALAPAGTANKTDVISYSMFYSGSAWTVLGQYSYYS